MSGPRVLRTPTTRRRARIRRRLAKLGVWALVWLGICLVCGSDTVRASIRPPADGSIVMKWSSPPPEPSAELERWHDDYVPALAPVEAAWLDLLRRMSRHRPARFEAQCRALSRELVELDRDRLLPAPEPLLDLHLKRLLEQLDRAAVACRGGELFNVIYRLEEARRALADIRELLDGRSFSSSRRDERAPPS